MRFDRERRAMGVLAQHPNIVAVYDGGVSPTGALFLVMEYLPRGSYAPWAGRLSPAEVADVGVKLAGALATAHRAGVLHRDIKPENVLISRYGEPLLADFGIARMTGAERSASGMITASLAYAAPEVLNGDHPGPPADLYCLGATLFALVSGRPPFARDDDSTVGLIARILREPVPDLRAEGVPSRLCDVLEQAMAKDPMGRPVDVLAFAESLRSVQREVGWPVAAPVVEQAAVHTATAAGVSRNVLPVGGPPSAPAGTGPAWPPSAAPTAGAPWHPSATPTTGSPRHPSAPLPPWPGPPVPRRPGPRRPAVLGGILAGAVAVVLAVVVTLALTLPRGPGTTTTPTGAPPSSGGGTASAGAPPATDLDPLLLNFTDFPPGAASSTPRTATFRWS